VAKTIQWAAPRGGRFAPQGERHSTFGRSQVPSGIVADMSTLRSIGAVEGDRVVAEAGATWSDVLRATLAQGKTPPVLTDYLELSVGGTLIVGGIGGTTSAFGVPGAIVAAPSGGLAFRLDAAKNFNGDPPDDNVLVAGLSDDSAQRQPTTIEFFDYLNRFAAFEATLRANGQWFFPHRGS
jgi:hypothetical protein